MSRIYLVLYHGNGGNWWEKLEDKLIRFFTRGRYSHCEIAIEKHHFQQGERYPEVVFDCYSSSPRDGGVRVKRMSLNENWTLVRINGVTEYEIKAYFAKTQGAKYDHLGALGIIAGVRASASKFFCSEWCFNAIFQSENGWHFSPNSLAEVVRRMK